MKNYNVIDVPTILYYFIVVGTSSIIILYIYYYVYRFIKILSNLHKCVLRQSAIFDQILFQWDPGYCYFAVMLNFFVDR